MVIADPEIRVGIVGFGYAAKTFHVPLIRATAGYRITAIASSRGADVSRTLADVDVVAGAEALAHRPDVDLIVIATPNDTHASLAEMFMRAGRNVVVEKPFTISASEARRLGAVAADTRTILSVFHNRRWDSDFRTVRDAVAGGTLGRIALFESRINRYRPQVRDRWRENPGRGAGLLYDLGPHLIDQTLLLFGVPDSVQATLAMQRRGARTVDYFSVVFRYGEMIATLAAGMLVSGGSARFSIHGSRASLVKRKMDVQEDQLRSGIAPGNADWGLDPDNAILYDGTSGEARAITALRGDQAGYYAALREAIHGRGANPVSPEQAATVIALIESAIRSDESGQRMIPDLTNEERAAWSALTAGR